jgi:hypothetical protein
VSEYRVPLWAQILYGPALPWTAVVAMPVAVVLVAFDLAPLAGLLVMAVLLAWTVVSWVAHRSLVAAIDDTEEP